jgi:hypothetical protein
MPVEMQKHLARLMEEGIEGIVTAARLKRILENSFGRSPSLAQIRRFIKVSLSMSYKRVSTTSQGMNEEKKKQQRKLAAEQYINFLH